MEKTDIRSMTLDELECFVMDGLGDKKFRARQIYDWMHVKLVQSFDEMTNLSKNLRDLCVYFFPGRLPYGLPFLRIYAFGPGTSFDGGGNARTGLCDTKRVGRESLQCGHHGDRGTVG